MNDLQQISSARMNEDEKMEIFLEEQRI